MNKPSPKNTAINTKRYNKWTRLFGSYRTTINRTVIEEWLNQFKKEHKDLAARLLDSVMFFELNSITSNFKAVLKSLNGWHQDEKYRSGRWFFVAMSGSAGESGDIMLREFRRANGLSHKMYNEHFITRSELVRKGLTHEDKVVLVDDFTATGDQVCEVWNDPEVAFSELTSGAGSVYLVVLAATDIAIDKIQTETQLEVVPAHSLNEKDNLFSPHCKHFTKDEKVIVLEYCTKANAKKPKGFGECGLVVVFNHGCPNNSIPILHSNSKKWNALFPRHD